MENNIGYNYLGNPMILMQDNQFGQDMLKSIGYSYTNEINVPFLKNIDNSSQNVTYQNQYNKFQNNNNYKKLNNRFEYYQMNNFNNASNNLQSKQGNEIYLNLPTKKLNSNMFKNNSNNLPSSQIYTMNNNYQNNSSNY